MGRIKGTVRQWILIWIEIDGHTGDNWHSPTALLKTLPDCFGYGIVESLVELSAATIRIILIGGYNAL
jgi:hypothetical protein